MKKLLPILGLIAVIALVIVIAPAPDTEVSAPAGGASLEDPGEGGTEPVVQPTSPIDMIHVDAGEFTMGSDEGSYDAKPAHAVELDAFFIDKYEVTQKTFERIVGENPARWKDPNGPVEQVRWTDAVKFCNARSKAEGLDPCYDEESWACDFDASGYRLPTEAEWEYACRAGTRADFYFGTGRKDLDDNVWHKGNARGRPHPVGRKRPNALGLHDMLGNVYEWCNDAYSPDAYRETVSSNPRGPDPEEWEKRVLRGGCWQTTGEKCRSWSRYCEDTGADDECYTADHIGFRCVRRAGE